MWDKSRFDTPLHDFEVILGMKWLGMYKAQNGLFCKNCNPSRIEC